MELAKYLISENASLLDCLQQINQLRSDLNLFVVDSDSKLLGSVTDGDIRRGLLKGHTLQDNIIKIMNVNCQYLTEGKIDLNLVIEQRKRLIRILPIVNSSHQIIALLNFNKVKTLIPVDAVVMAGGTGSRLLPMTQKVPKPLLPIAGKPILGYTLERLQKFGIHHISITVNYLREQIEQYVAETNREDVLVRCVREEKPLGTMGAVSLINNWQHDHVLLTNSDLLTNIDYEDFFLEFIKSGADMMVAVIAYPLKVPYAIFETEGDQIKAFKEKPEYTYYANTGIYLFKRELLSLVPSNTFFNATDFMDVLLSKKKKLSYYPITSYWLDIGNHDDFKKAQIDIKHLSF
jgi:dTDP-glucose pyrophosphorylase